VSSRLSQIFVTMQFSLHTVLDPTQFSIPHYHRAATIGDMADSGRSGNE
jgi:hypothetical protein